MTTVTASLTGDAVISRTVLGGFVPPLLSFPGLESGPLGFTAGGDCNILGGPFYAAPGTSISVTLTSLSDGNVGFFTGTTTSPSAATENNWTNVGSLPFTFTSTMQNGTSYYWPYSWGWNPAKTGSGYIGSVPPGFPADAVLLIPTFTADALFTKHSTVSFTADACILTSAEVIFTATFDGPGLDPGLFLWPNWTDPATRGPDPGPVVDGTLTTAGIHRTIGIQGFPDLQLGIAQFDFYIADWASGWDPYYELNMTSAIDVWAFPRDQENNAWLLGGEWDASDYEFLPQYGEWWTIKTFIQAGEGNPFCAKVWKRGDPEPDWQVLSTRKQYFWETYLQVDSGDVNLSHLDNLVITTYNGAGWHWLKKFSADAFFMDVAGTYRQSTFTVDAYLFGPTVARFRANAIFRKEQIGQTFHIGQAFLDTFTRTSTAPPFGAGTPDIGNAWQWTDWDTHYGSAAESETHIDGSTLTLGPNTYDSLYGPPSLSLGELKFDFWVPAADDNGLSIYYDDREWHFQLVDYSNTYFHLSGNPRYTWYSFPVTRSAWHRIRFLVTAWASDTKFVLAHIWKIGDPEPETWTSIQNIWPSPGIIGYEPYDSQLPILDLYYTPYHEFLHIDNFTIIVPVTVNGFYADAIFTLAGRILADARIGTWADFTADADLLKPGFTADAMIGILAWEDDFNRTGSDLGPGYSQAPLSNVDWGSPMFTDGDTAVLIPAPSYYGYAVGMVALDLGLIQFDFHIAQTSIGATSYYEISLSDKYSYYGPYARVYGLQDFTWNMDVGGNEHYTFTPTDGEWWTIKAFGSSSSSIKAGAKVWKRGDPEPDGWQVYGYSFGGNGDLPNIQMGASFLAPARLDNLRIIAFSQPLRHHCYFVASATLSQERGHFYLDAELTEHQPGSGVYRFNALFKHTVARFISAYATIGHKSFSITARSTFIAGYVRKTQQFSCNAVFLTYPSLTSDAILLASRGQAFTGDALLAQYKGRFTLDAVTRRTVAHSFGAYSLMGRRTFFTANATLRTTVTPDHRDYTFHFPGVTGWNDYYFLAGPLPTPTGTNFEFGFHLDSFTGGFLGWLFAPTEDPATSQSYVPGIHPSYWAFPFDYAFYSQGAYGTNTPGYTHTWLVAKPAATGAGRFWLTPQLSPGGLTADAFFQGNGYTWVPGTIQANAVIQTWIPLSTNEWNIEAHALLTLPFTIATFVADSIFAGTKTWAVTLNANAAFSRSAIGSFTVDATFTTLTHGYSFVSGAFLTSLTPPPGGGDGTVNGNTFSSPSGSFTSGNIGDVLVINGTVRFITGVTDSHTVTISGDPWPSTTGAGWVVEGGAPIPPAPTVYTPTVYWPKVLITVDGTDVTDSVLWRESWFEQQAKVAPGQCEVHLRGVFDFHGGEEIICAINDVRVFGGYVISVGANYFFPYVKEGKTILQGTDYNVLFDRLYLYNRASPSMNDPNMREGPYDPIPVIPVHSQDGDIIRKMCVEYLNLPANLDYVTFVENVGDITPWTGGQIATGMVWRRAMQEFSMYTGAVWYIDANMALHNQSRETVNAPYPISDGPIGVACRNLVLSEDVSQMRNDVMVWGVLANTISGRMEWDHQVGDMIQYATPQVTPWGTTAPATSNSINQYGRWGYAEWNSDLHTQEHIIKRGRNIFNRWGRAPVWTGSCDLYQPGYVAGQVVTVISSEYGIALNLVIRSQRITFLTGGYSHRGIPSFALQLGLAPDDAWTFYDILPFEGWPTAMNPHEAKMLNYFDQGGANIVDAGDL